MSIAIKKVLISDNVDKKCEYLLKENGIDVVCKYNLSADELIQELQNCQGLIVRSDTKVTKEVIDASKSLKVIGRAGTGVDNIDVPEATKNGVIVLNAPNGNSVSACELTCSFITCLARHVTVGCQTMKEGRWERKTITGGVELEGKTLAVIGLGKIGKEVAKRMKSFGMKIIGYDPFVTEEEATTYSIKKMELEEIWPLADYITVHTPLIPQTKNLLNLSAFKSCKPSVKVINAARGGIINEGDLLYALNNGLCSGAALDVFSEEPPKSDLLKQLISHPNVIATPHLGASTKEAQIRVAVEVAEQFVALSDPTSPYSLTGVLNASALLACRDAASVAWIALAELLGRTLSLVARPKLSATGPVRISLAGPEIENKKFLSSSVLLGFLSGNVKNGLNLINIPWHSRQAGLSFTFDDYDGKSNATNRATGNVLKISVGNEITTYSIQGTVIDDIPYLLQINDATFSANRVILKNNIKIYSCARKNTSEAIDAATRKYENIENISISYGIEEEWIVLSVKGADDDNIEYTFHKSN